MLDLALYYGKGPILLKDIAMRQEIPLRYLEQFIVPLKASGLVKSTRGARGGYVLSRLPSDIKLSEIIYVLEGSIVPVECVTQPKNCHRSENLLPGISGWKCIRQPRAYLNLSPLRNW
jgi:Rrf2 family protein